MISTMAFAPPQPPVSGRSMASSSAVWHRDGVQSCQSFRLWSFGLRCNAQGGIDWSVTNTTRPPCSQATRWYDSVQEKRGNRIFADLNGGVKLFSRSAFLSAVFALVLFSELSFMQPQPSFSQTDINANGETIVVGHGAGALTKKGKNRDWAELTEPERAAANFLGFTAELWDTDNKVYIDRLTWEELSPAQKKAAKALSFDKASWNNDVFVDIYERSWNELTDAQKAAAKELGYKHSSWDRDSHVWSDDRSWHQLSPAQRQAAETLGYTPQEWDDTRRVYEKAWRQLNQVQRIAAEELGYTEKRWDRDRHVFSDDLLWRQLTPRQRWAAKVIGFSENTWDDATRAGSHSTDSEQARRKELRSKTVQEQCSGLWPALKGPFSFGRGDCSRPGKPWYVPNFMGSEWYNFVPTTPNL